MTRVKPPIMTQYREAYNAVWQRITELSQVVTEDFPDPNAANCEPTRYHIDTLRALAGELGALLATP